jgi:deoxyuridine 5'-triphosphate nucleotidohydrolase
VAVDIPAGLWAQITGRSSTLQKLNLMVAPTAGVIDEGYTGELFAPVVSNSDSPVYITKGQRIAQLILHEAPGQRYVPAWGVCRDKTRGANGFGSTGR